MNKIDRLFEALEEELAEGLANFDPVNVFYGVLIFSLLAFIFLAPWLF